MAASIGRAHPDVAAAAPTAARDGLAGLRIALVGPVPPPAGGMAGQTRLLLELLSEAGAAVELVATNRPYRPRWIGSLPIVRAAFRLVPYVGHLWRTAGRADLVHVMANSGWAWHLFAAPAIWIAKGRRVPVVVNYRGGEAASFLARSHRIVCATLRGTTLVVPSAFLEGVFARHGTACTVVVNVVDGARFRPGAAPAAPHVVVARNLEPLYDNATALRAFALVAAQHPDSRITIAGSGPDEAALRALACELGIDSRVAFAGRLDRDAVAALLRTASVALNPSLADNSPNSLLEAMACAVPVVSTDVGGVPYLVEHERSALLVPPRDPPAMAQAILRLLDDPELARALARQGHEVARHHDWRAVAPQWAAVYRRAGRRV